MLRGSRCFLLPLLALVACGGEERAAAAAAEPFVARFAEIEAWCHRALRGAPAMRDRARLEDTLFAPLLLEDDIAGVWLQQRRPREARYVFRARWEELDRDAFTRLRIDGRRFEVAQGEGALTLAAERRAVWLAVAFSR